MTYSSIDPRQLVVSLAGALFTSLLFVSAATSLPNAALSSSPAANMAPSLLLATGMSAA